ncbi:MAG: S9 family peptidase [Bacteroidales bacterium]|nr:MAG: S9 family peptidase [Bacteroidales bacterium]
MNKKIFLTIAIFILGNATFFAQNADSFIDEYTSGKWRSKSPFGTIKPMKDGKRFLSISYDSQQIIANNYTNEKLTVILDLSKIKDCPIKAIEDFELDESEKYILLHGKSNSIYRHSFTTEWYVYNCFRGTIEPLSNEGEQQEASFSPNGRIVAFARGNNLFLKKLDFGTESQITKDGKKNKIINGIADWVYEEEFANVKYFEFSPDSRLLAFVKFYEEPVKEYSMQVFNGLYPSVKKFKYPKAGTENSKVSVWIYDIENRTTTKMGIEGNDFYIPSIKWTSSSDALSVLKLSRDQKQIEILSINPRSGVTTKLYEERSKRYIDYENFATIKFNPDNSFVVLSEKDGYRHIYLHYANGLEKRQLTKGDFDVTAFYGYDTNTQTAYFQAAKQHPTQREIYKSQNGNIKALDSRVGYQYAKFSNGFKYAILNYSSKDKPDCYTVINNSGKKVRTLYDNNDLFDRYNKAITNKVLPQKKFFSFTTSQGVKLDGWYINPINQDISKKTRIMLTQYSGPDSQRALNRWDIGWEYYMAMNGFMVVCVDGRGTGAKGNEFRTCTYGQLGILETKDQIETAKYFKTQYPDATMAIWGWSFGGFMTLSCMTTEGSPFDAGVAIAPVTDWRYYNTAYTERFMNRPQENFDGYDKASVVNRADKLNGELLLIHGTSDDNVHIQNSYIMAEELVKSNINFDMQIYTNKNHSLLGKSTRMNLYKKCYEFLNKKMQR